MTGPFRKTLLALTSLLTIHTSISHAADLPGEPADWRWFDVEVLVFKQSDESAANTEQFPYLLPTSADATAVDMLTSYYVPDITSYLHASPPCDFSSAWERGYLEPFEWLCHQPEEVDPYRLEPLYQPQAWLTAQATTPVSVIDGGTLDMRNTPQAFLLPETANELTELGQQLERRGTGTALLHMSYRQPVFGRDQNYQIRLFGGANLAFTAAESERLSPLEQAPDELTAEPESELFDELAQLFTQIEQANSPVFNSAVEQANQAKLSLDLAQDSGNPLWELDGTLHVYLVGNYLHIQNNLQLRQIETALPAELSLAMQAEQTLVGADSRQLIQTYLLTQLRRVISHETHYFDHPKFGVVVQIRRTELSARR